MGNDELVFVLVLEEKFYTMIYCDFFSIISSSQSYRKEEDDSASQVFKEHIWYTEHWLGTTEWTMKLLTSKQRNKK